MQRFPHGPGDGEKNRLRHASGDREGEALLRPDDGADIALHGVAELLAVDTHRLNIDGEASAVIVVVHYLGGRAVGGGQHPAAHQAPSEGCQIRRGQRTLEPVGQPLHQMRSLLGADLYGMANFDREGPVGGNGVGGRGTEPAGSGPPVAEPANEGELTPGFRTG